MPDLIDLVRAKQAIFNPDPTADAFVNELIAGASAAVRRYCRREFAEELCDELHVPCAGGVRLRHFPVLELQGVAASDGPALAIRQSDPAVAQASARLSETGLTLSRTVAGVEVVDDSIVWSANPTLADLVSAVTALGDGWSAESKVGFEIHSSADLRPLQHAQECRVHPAEFRLHRAPVEAIDFDARAGLLRLPSRFDGVEVRVRYRAGLATPPEDVQQATALLVADWYAQSRHDPARRWQDRLDDAYGRFESLGMPSAVVRLLQSYRDLAG